MSRAKIRKTSYIGVNKDASDFPEMFARFPENTSTRLSKEPI